MKKSFLLSFSKGLIAFGFCAAVVAMTACSESSSSGGGATQPCADASCANLPQNPNDPFGNSQVSNASKCDLATQKLPASSLAWQPTFSGGCEVSQQIALDELLKFDTLLIAAGYEKKELTQSSYRYTLETPNIETATSINDTLEFTYMQGTFAGFFRSATSAIDKVTMKKILVKQACPSLIPETVFEKDVCISVDNKGEIAPESFLILKEASSLLSDLKNYGWICEIENGMLYTCNVNHNGNLYSLQYIYQPDKVYAPDGSAPLSVTRITHFNFQVSI